MSQFIPLQQAVEMTSRYRGRRDNVLDPAYRGKNILCICETFDRSEFDTILAKPGCTGLRIYYGMDASDKVHAIIVGVNAQNEDMILSAAARGGDNDDVIEEGRRCPEDCPPESILNEP
jgi:hypothetical protein